MVHSPQDGPSSLVHSPQDLPWFTSHKTNKISPCSLTTRTSMVHSPQDLLADMVHPSQTRTNMIDSPQKTDIGHETNRMVYSPQDLAWFTPSPKAIMVHSTRGLVVCLTHVVSGFMLTVFSPALTVVVGAVEVHVDV